MRVKHLGVDMYANDKRHCERLIDGFFLETFTHYDKELPSRVSQAIAAKMERVLENELAQFFALENEK